MNLSITLSDELIASLSMIHYPDDDEALIKNMMENVVFEASNQMRTELVRLRSEGKIGPQAEKELNEKLMATVVPSNSVVVSDESRKEIQP